MADGGRRIPSVLACDIGNSALHLACVAGEDVTPVKALPVGELAGLTEVLTAMWEDMPEPKKLVAASVNPAALKALESAALAALGEQVIVVGRDVAAPIETALAAPEAVGMDRLCAAVAAFDRLGLACVVADFGTAITVDCVSDAGVFLGGAILPGLRLSAACLHNGTALLPEVEPAEPDWTFGKDTRQAIAGGLVFGARGALRELVEAYATELGSWPVVIATGGDARLVCGDPNDSGLVQAIVPDLTLRGVAMAYYKTLLK